MSKNINVDYCKYISKIQNYFIISKNFFGLRFYYGAYKDLNVTIRILHELIENKWDEEELGLNIIHIFKIGEEYNIYKIINHVPKYFGTYSSKSEALNVENFLKENKWNREKLSLKLYQDFLKGNNKNFCIENYVSNELKMMECFSKTRGK